MWHEPLAAERLGIPEVAVMTDRFAVSVREIAAIEGLPDYPFVVIDHPIAGNPAQELHAKAEGALAEVLSLLIARKTGS